MTAAEDAVRDRFRRFAAAEARPGSPLYAELAGAVADDRRLRAFVAALPDTQPNLLFAAVQYLTGPELMPADGHELRSFVDLHADAVATLVRRRAVQTNEVARCAVLLPALPREPLALLEVGASAGLCLLPDRYAYHYGPRQLGDPAAAVGIACTPLSPLPLPETLPIIAWRRGVDRSPVDVFDPDAVRWLAACVWADQPARRARLLAAVEVARSDPPPVERGDLVDELPRLARAAPADAHLVVFHGGVLPYLRPGRRAAFVRVLEELAATRPLTWISNEAPGVAPGFPEVQEAGGRLRFVLNRAWLTPGGSERAALALADPHGADLMWLRR